MRYQIPFMTTLTVIMTMFFPACTGKNVSAVPEGKTLVWSDEFDQDGAPDSDKWNYSVGGNGWGNAELQTYTNKRENSEVRKGILSITARNDNGRWTSARLKTQYKAGWKYGYLEVRAKLPEGRGTWPAIWMLPVGDKYGGWPRSGEIDVIEHVGFDQDRIHATVHTRAFNHRLNTQKSASAVVKGVSSAFHVYAIEWTPQWIQWYVDGELIFRFENSGEGVAEWPFDIPFYLILNVAIGGTWGGEKGIDPKLQDATMQVDYVRVYQ
ncbi:MAG: glycoside hydrolase family 16 protein [Treponema sp.]|jgi:beta-glucanase (GH16 family)|nr:glycoside hydrolase family 16 protein [Treponema sp.]